MGFFGEDKNVLKLYSGYTIYTILWLYEKALNYTVKKNDLYTENYKALLKQIKRIWINRKISYAYGLEECCLTWQ